MTRRDAVHMCLGSGAVIVGGAVAHFASRGPVPAGGEAGVAPEWVPWMWRREYPGGWIAEVADGKQATWWAYGGGTAGHGVAGTVGAAMEAAEAFVAGFTVRPDSRELGDG